VAVIPVGGGPITWADVTSVIASHARIMVGPETAFLKIGETTQIIPYGSDREQQLLMLASIGDTIREQAKEQLAAIRAAEVE
jgi:hypothetical protein